MLRAALVVFVAAAAVISADTFTAQRVPPPPPPGPPVLARLSGGMTSQLARVDAQTLRVIGRRVDLGLHDVPWAPAPRGRVVAFGSGRATTIRFVDIRLMRSLGTIDTRGFVTGFAWVDRRTLLVLSTRGCCPGEARALVVDAELRRIVRTYPLPAGSVLGFARTRRGFAALVGPHDAIGPLSLLHVRADAGVAVVELRRVEGGWRREDRVGARPIVHSRVPALAVDPSGARAAVVATTGVIAEIDLGSLRVTHHVPRRQLSLAQRLALWFVPDARADGNALSDISVRRARWVGDTLVVAGSDDRVVRDGAAETQRTDPHGLHLIDTHDWTYRIVDSKSTAFAVAGETLLAHGDVGLPPVLVAYDVDGSERWRLEGAGLPRVAAGRVYLGGDFEFRRHRVRIVDLRTGRTLGIAVGQGAVSVLGAPEPCWC